MGGEAGSEANWNRALSQQQKRSGELRVRFSPWSWASFAFCPRVSCKIRDHHWSHRTRHSSAQKTGETQSRLRGVLPSHANRTCARISKVLFPLRPSLAERDCPDCPGASVGNLPGANFTPRGRSSFWYTFNYFLISLALLHHIYLYFHAWVAAVIDQHQDFLHLISGEKVLLNH